MVFSLPHVPLRFTATSTFFFFYLQEGKQLQKQEMWSCRKVSQRKWWKRAVGMWWEEMRATKVVCLPAVVYLWFPACIFKWLHMLMWNLILQFPKLGLFSPDDGGDWKSSRPPNGSRKRPGSLLTAFPRSHTWSWKTRTHNLPDFAY